MDKKYLCKSCGYKWESKKSWGEPNICPKCKKEYIIKYSKTKEGIKEKKRIEKEERKWEKEIEIVKSILRDIKN